MPIKTENDFVKQIPTADPMSAKNVGRVLPDKPAAAAAMPFVDPMDAKGVGRVMDSKPTMSYGHMVDQSTRPHLNENSIQAQQQMLRPSVVRQNSLQEPGEAGAPAKFYGGRRASDTEFLKNARHNIVGEFERYANHKALYP